MAAENCQRKREKKEKGHPFIGTFFLLFKSGHYVFKSFPSYSLFENVILHHSFIFYYNYIDWRGILEPSQTSTMELFCENNLGLAFFNYCERINRQQNITEVHLEPSVTSTMKLFCKNNGFQPLTIFVKQLHRRCLTRF